MGNWLDDDLDMDEGEMSEFALRERWRRQEESIDARVDLEAMCKVNNVDINDFISEDEKYVNLMMSLGTEPMFATDLTEIVRKEMGEDFYRRWEG